MSQVINNFIIDREKKLAQAEGFEPPTRWLTATCSTPELRLIFLFLVKEKTESTFLFDMNLINIENFKYEMFFCSPPPFYLTHPASL